jgi:hypothetical protein
MGLTLIVEAIDDDSRISAAVEALNLDEHHELGQVGAQPEPDQSISSRQPPPFVRREPMDVPVGPDAQDWAWPNGRDGCPSRYY